MHLFTCSCGEPFPVSPAQAGQSVECPHCGQANELPRLGDLKNLPVEDQAESVKPARWSAGRGIVFSILCAGLVAGIVSSLVCSYRWLSIPKPPTVAQVIQDGQADIDSRNAPQILEFWMTYARPGMGVRNKPYFAQVAEYRSGWQTWAIASYAISALFLTASIIVIRSKQSDSLE